MLPFINRVERCEMKKAASLRKRPSPEDSVSFLGETSYAQAYLGLEDNAIDPLGKCSDVDRPGPVISLLQYDSSAAVDDAQLSATTTAIFQP